jgi:DNA-3-methyladenine glycosylase II
MAALPGLRPVCFTSPYETAAWAVISQRISMRQAAGIKERLIAEYGEPVRVGGAEVRCFPVPERLIRLDSFPGLSKEKVGRLRGVAKAALEGLLDADRLRALGHEAGPASLLAIAGIGPFWSQGIYLRGCGIADVYPAEPLSIAALGHVHGLGDRPDAATVERLTEPYRPFRMWVSFLLRVSAGRGLVPGVAGREGPIRQAAR